jgi:hypothetical protein
MMVPNSVFSSEQALRQGKAVLQAPSLARVFADADHAGARRSLSENLTRFSGAVLCQNAPAW